MNKVNLFINNMVIKFQLNVKTQRSFSFEIRFLKGTKWVILFKLSLDFVMELLEMHRTIWTMDHEPYDFGHEIDL